MLGKLLRRLRGGADAANLKLVVSGRITESGRHTPRTHLGPNQATEEAWFGVDIRSAGLNDGSTQDPARVLPAEFSGDLQLLDTFAIGADVRIVCTTATGRQIESIETVET